MSDYKTEYQVRLEKLKKIREQGINPYPAKYDKQNPVLDIQEKSDGTQLKTAGRLMSIREMGKIIFCHLQDDSGRAQIALKQNEVREDDFNFFQKFIDIGDFIGLEGEVFTTQKGEKTLLVKKYEFLSKALLPLPEKWHGIKDEEERLRKRYLNILVNPTIKDMVVKKFVFWNSIRQFMVSKNFIEVETPILENITGGADAKPFITHHNALDIDVYLRISTGELWQKKLMVAGLDKVFEIGRIFRNEGMDPEHLQDYTQLEFYWAYTNWQDSMKLVEELVKHTAQTTFHTLKFKIKGFDIDLSKDWEQYDYRQEVLKQTQIDIQTTNLAEIKNKLQALKVDYDDFNNLSRGIDQLWKYCRKNISGPGFLIYPPKLISPLAKESTIRPGYVEQYQLILGGSELCKGYSELNDPIDQEKRFKEQTKFREQGDEEAQMHDKEFVEALKHGMPPTTGLGLSERLFAFLIDKPIRECQLFPLMRPKSRNHENTENTKIQNSVGAPLAGAQPEGRAGPHAPAEDSDQTEDLGLTCQQAQQLVDQYIVDKKTKFHLLESEAIMRALARHFSEDEEKWGIVGLLHDIDWDLTKDNVKQHTIKAVDILKQAGATDFLIETIISHAFGASECGQYPDKQRTTKIQHALAAAETITGLIFASALMQPDKKLSSVKPSSLKKKFKDLRFAANCNREIILECEKIGLSLEEFLDISLKAMQEIAGEIGL